jgi:nitrogen fixation/metabolism regulation signal transduction histidine kinase
MVYTRFYVNVVVRIILLTANCMVFAFAWYGTGNYFTLINLGLLILLQTILFIYYLNKTNRDLAYFFDSIRDEETGITFNRTKRKFKNIYSLMDEVNDRIKAMRAKYAAQDQYFKTIIEHIQTGLVSFGQDGKVDIMNSATKKMLGLKAIHKIDSFNKVEEGLGDVLAAISPSEKKLVCVHKNNEMVHLSLDCTVIKFIDKELKIITFHDITPELDKKELESWQKLIRILNHEIMNSLAPIVSTASTLTNFLSGQNARDQDGSIRQWDRVLEKTIAGLSIINERSEGLKNFVENYRALNTLPQPVIVKFNVSELLKNCVLFFNDKFQSGHINCITEIAVSDMVLEADKSQIQQILLNLMNNAIESLAESETNNKTIRLKAFYHENGEAVLQVSDNGKGIPSEMVDQVFVPFFTTKEKGSGIGLSLSRQIMHLNGGTISVHSKPGHETVFTMVF